MKVWTLFLVIFIFAGCEKKMPDKYIPKDWLKGKIFTQISEQDDLNTFILCLELTGYDTLLNTSGSYSVFAPTDDAFDLFFQEHSEDNSLEDIPEEELIKIVEYQIIYDAWSIQQFQSLDYFGWIDPGNKLHKPRAYKHKTIYHPENRLYPVKFSGNTYRIAHPQESNRTFRAFTQSNKYCPVFFNEYFDVYGLNYDDY